MFFACRWPYIAAGDYSLDLLHLFMHYICAVVEQPTVTLLRWAATVTRILALQPSSAADQEVFSLVNSEIRIHLPARIIITRPYVYMEKLHNQLCLERREQFTAQHNMASQ